MTSARPVQPVHLERMQLRGRQPTGARFPPWFANVFTLGRLALLPAFFLAAEATRAAVGSGAASGGPRAIALLVLVLMAASDRLDGYVARRSVAASATRGAVLDALADRLVQWSGALYFAFLAQPGFTPLPLWLLTVLLGREVVLSGVWIHTRRSGIVSFDHERHGKAATVLLFALLLAATAALDRIVFILSALTAVGVAYSAMRYAARTLRRST